MSGSGTFGTLFTSQSAGINLQGTAFTLPGNITTTGGGSLILQSTGALVLSGPTFTISGSVQVLGLGITTLSSAITAGAVIPATNTGIQIAGPLIAAGGSLSTAAINKDINIASTIDGSSPGIGNLTLNAGTLGNITVLEDIGSNTRLGSLIFTNAHDITTPMITAASITQMAGSGLTTMIGNLNTSAIGGMNFVGTNFTLDGSFISTNGGPFSIDHTGLLTLTAGSSTLLTGAFTESGAGGTVTLSGMIHATDVNLTFSNPITLAGNTTLNSNTGGDILIGSTVDGPFDLLYIAGTGNITLAAAIGSIDPVSSLTFQSATNISTQAISAGKIIQNSGTGLTTFHGSLTTTLSDGIELMGTAFTFGVAPTAISVTTLNGGHVQITNSGLLTMPAIASFNLDGFFSQLGGGPVSLCTTITTSGDAVSFTGPITLCGDAIIDAGPFFGEIRFESTIDGAHDLTLFGTQGNIVILGNIGAAVPLDLFHVVNGVNLTTQSIHATTIDIGGLTGLGTFNGTLTTTGPLGITLNGDAFTLSGNVTTSNGGPLAITNTGILTIGPSIALSIDGAFTQTQSGTLNIQGSITTNAQPITFAGPLNLQGDLTLTSGNGDITFGADIEGPYTLTINAGMGDVTAVSAFSITDPLNNFIVASSNNISLNGVGSTMSLLSGQLSLTASNTISLMNTTYAAHSQFYASGGNLNFVNSDLITLITDGGDITFASPAAILNSHTDLSIQTQGGNFAFNAIHGTDFENLTINTGSGTAFLGALPSVGHINTVTVNAGQILIQAPMNMENTDFTSLGEILNSGAPVSINSTNTASFNALGGDVGTLASPIFVNTTNQIFVGADGHVNSLANIIGSSQDNTVHPIVSNPPCVIIFNGIVIQNCALPPVPPSPPSPPSPSSPSKVIAFPFAVPGFDSSFFNLASDYFFFVDFLDDRYLRRSAPPMYYRAK